MTGRAVQLSGDVAVGVVGAGTMGTGIAQLAATFGHSTTVVDSFPGALEKSEAGLKKVFERLVEKGRIGPADASAILGRIEFSPTLDAVRECGLVIEAIVEDLDAKKVLLSRVEALTADHCVLATNTSSLSIAAISSACRVPSRFLGVHFFNPAPLMPLVEIVPGISSDPAVVAATRTLVDGWKKTTVLARDTPGFIVNRVARPFYGEALRILDEGIADAATIDWAMRELGGFRMGPFELMDFIGNDVNYAVTETVFAAFFYDPRYRPSTTQKRLVEAGMLGKKSGRGFYNYGANAATPVPSTESRLGQDIVDRVVAMLINEAADALFWGVATRDDIDLAMTRGVKYPQGLLRWCDTIGIDVVLARLENLQETYGEDRYRPSPLVRRMAASGATFYE